jgi:hypothetical protein
MALNPRYASIRLPLLGSEMSPHKVPKKSVKYGRAKNVHTRCGNCRYFLAPNDCQRVLGKVEAMGWCELWTERLENVALAGE